MKHNFRLGLGPMSYEIVESLASYASAGNPLMLIASRNQVDRDSGYVMNTKQLRAEVDRYPTDYLLLCRDHCGPYFLDSEKNLDQRSAIEACKKTIAADIEAGFDLIHIDTSRCYSGYLVAEELIKFCLSINPDIMFEFGTEENVGVAAGAEKYKADVLFAKDFPNMQFVVAQTGSLTLEDKQAGEFDSAVVSDLVDFAEHVGVKLKEHNADYLTGDQIQLRKLAGVHALNIAPQLGVMQTRLIKELALENNLNTEWENFANAVYASEKWRKWFPVSHSKELMIEVAGHYLYQDPTYKRLVDELDKSVYWRTILSNELTGLIQLYEHNL